MKSLLLSAALAVSLLSSAAIAAGPIASSRVWVSGDSTVRAFRCDAKRVELKLSGVDEVQNLEQLERAPVRAVAKILVSTLDCANSTMNDHMRDAMKMREHPEISIDVKSVEWGRRDGDSAAIMAKADLTMAGQTRSVLLRGTAKQNDAGIVVVFGEHALKMTDYGIKPPSLMLGTMKVKDEVTVGFELKMKAPAPKEAPKEPVVVGAASN